VNGGNSKKPNSKIQIEVAALRSSLRLRVKKFQKPNPKIQIEVAALRSSLRLRVKKIPKTKSQNPN
jgi:hypothetical protein